MYLNDTTKRCSHCRRDLPLTEYQKNRKRTDGLQDRCKTCRKAHATDPERKRLKVIYDAQRRIDQGDTLRQQARDRYQDDPNYRDRQIKRSRRQRQQPGYHEQERQRHYKRWADPAYRAQRVVQHRERRRRDPEYRRKVYHWRRARQARIKLQGNPFTHAEWVALCERYDHRCLCCDKQKPLSPDHVVPVSRGGTSDISNIQPLCVDCNKRKNARTIDYRLGWGG